MPNRIAWCVGHDGKPGESWNPVKGCSPVSAGCDHCWARGMASRGMSEEHRSVSVWTGARFFPDALTMPLRRRKPTGYAVCLMGDLVASDADALLDCLKGCNPWA